MSYLRNPSLQEEGNPMALPSRSGNKRYRVEAELKAKNKTKKRASHSSASTPLPQSFVSQCLSHLSTQHIPKNNPANPPTDLSKFKDFSNSPFLSSPPQRPRQPQRTSYTFPLRNETMELGPSGMSLPLRSSLKLDPNSSSKQISRRRKFRSTIDVSNFFSQKTERKNEEELDTQLSLGSSQSSSKTALTLEVDTHENQSIDTPTSKSCKSSIPELGIPPSQLTEPQRKTTSSISKSGDSPSKLTTPEINTTLGISKLVISSELVRPEKKPKPSISKLGISPCQLVTPMKQTYEQKIELLRQQSRAETAHIDAVQRETLEQARIESLRREILLNEHLKRNNVSDAKAEDLLSQSLRMRRFLVSPGEFLEKRSRESSWTKNHIKEYTPNRSFERESEWNENSRTGYLFSSKKESSASEDWGNINLLTSRKQNPVEGASFTSQEAEVPLSRSGIQRVVSRSVFSSAGHNQKRRVKELGPFAIVSEEQGYSHQWSQPNHHQQQQSPEEIDLSLGL